MESQAAVAATATLIAVAFALATLERWRDRRRRHELAWTLALAFFAAGSAALWAGAAFGWHEWDFKLFYLFGAVINVPVLAVGTIYLLAGEQQGDRAFLAALLFSMFAAGWILAAPLVGAIEPDQIPQGKEVFGPVPRALAAVGSGVGATVLLVGAGWSAVRLLRRGKDVPVVAGAPSPRRLAGANLLIAAGTLVLSAGGLLNSVVGEMDAFSLSLVVGISFIFAGFLVSSPSTPRPTPSMPAWIEDILDERPSAATPHHIRPGRGRRPTKSASKHRPS